MLLLGLIIVLGSLSYGRCFSVVGFPSFGQERQHQLFMVTESAYLERPTIPSPATIKRDEPIQMVPLSCPPLLLLQSSARVISKEECDSLIEYFDYITSPTDDDYRLDTLDATQIEYAKSLLDDVHNIIDTVTNCPKHDGETKLPRYVRYYPTVIDEDILSDPKSFSQVLLPDGVHVDTNNGKLFRHITAILYLTDNPSSDTFNFGGGTTFPLAMPWSGADDMNDDSLLLTSSAKALLERNIQHTKADIDQSTNSDGHRLELACVNTFNRDREKGTFGCDHNNVGVRVTPQAGRLIMFHNVDDAGTPDPTSFHGGEELISIRTNQKPTQNEMTKKILVFFKEIPLNSFTDQESFADCAAKARQWTTQTYYQ